jgi:hypothetical protein
MFGERRMKYLGYIEQFRPLFRLQNLPILLSSTDAVFHASNKVEAERKPPLTKSAELSALKLNRLSF